jgi:hypothetical protein
LLAWSLTEQLHKSPCLKEHTPLEVVGYSSRRFTNGEKFMLKEKGFTLRFFSRVLAIALISTITVGLPSANAGIELQVHDPASLIAAGLDPAVTSVKINQDINLSANLVINHDMSITRGDLYTSTVPMISGAGIEITSGAVVTMSYLGLSGANVRTDGAYGVMVQDGSSLNASNITMTMDTLARNNTGYFVATGSKLSLSSSSVTWGANAATSQQYAIYSQSGAGAISLSLNTFKFNAANVPNNYSSCVATDGTSVANYSNLSLTGNTCDAYMKLMLLGSDSVANKQAWARKYVSATEGDNRIGIMSGLNSDLGNGLYTNLGTGWRAGLVSVMTAEEVAEAEALAKANISTMLYTLSPSSTTIEIDLKDEYGYLIVFVDVKKSVLINGKYVLRYVRIDTVILDEFGAVSLKTTVGIKTGDVIRVSVIGATTDTPVKYVTVK